MTFRGSGFDAAFLPRDAFERRRAWPTAWEAVADAMPCYPAEGCIAIIDDLCVVRFS